MDGETRVEKLRSWAARQRTNPAVQQWIDAHEIPAGEDPYFFAFENAADRDLMAWSDWDPIPRAVRAADPLLPLAVEPPLGVEAEPGLEETIPAIGATEPPVADAADAPDAPAVEVETFEIPAEAALPTRISWLNAAAAGEPPTPLIKMPGSKRWLCPCSSPQIVAYLEETGGRFFEPFAGSAALALAVAAEGCAAVISDANTDMMAILAAARDTPTQFFKALAGWVEWGISEDHYFQARAYQPPDMFMRAVRALYLARLSFNGLWRVNSKGEFNVPYGQSASRGFPGEAAIRAVARALRTCTVLACDYREALAVEAAGEGDVVFCDPPYTGTFTGYTAQGWTREDDANLERTLRTAARNGVGIILTAPAAPEIWDRYAWTHRVVVPRRHNVAASAKARVVYPEAIYTTVPELVDLSRAVPD